LIHCFKQTMNNEYATARRPPPATRCAPAEHQR
jgi:hypothetical protein